MLLRPKNECKVFLFLVSEAIDCTLAKSVGKSATLVKRDDRKKLQNAIFSGHHRMGTSKNSSTQGLGMVTRKSVLRHRIHLVFRVGFCLCCLAMTCTGANSGKEQLHSPGLAAEFAASSDEVLQALNEVLGDQIIHGTLIYDREPTLTGAVAVTSTPLFESWQGPGQVFYKIRKDAIAPRHFLESGDQGTIGVRYVVTSVSPERTRIRIDAVYVENTHRRVHASDGTVEASEFKAIQEHLQAIQLAEQESADAKRRRDSAEAVRQSIIRQHEDETTRLAAAQSSRQDLEQRVDALRHELEQRVKAPGADLKAAPFRSAASLKILPAFTEVVIIIVTAHWYGVETPDGQRGWIPRDQLESLP